MRSSVSLPEGMPRRLAISASHTAIGVKASRIPYRAPSTAAVKAVSVHVFWASSDPGVIPTARDGRCLSRTWVQVGVRDSWKEMRSTRLPLSVSLRAD
jgi:hypothetical protein